MRKRLTCTAMTLLLALAICSGHREPHGARPNSGPAKASNPAAASPQRTVNTSEIVRETADAVVSNKGSGNGETTFGSGFIVSPDGKIVTCLHVVRDLKTAAVHLASDEIFDSFSVLVFDARRDLVVIQVSGFDLPAVKLGNSNEVKTGERVSVIGSPLGLQGTVTTGVISAIR